MPKKESEDSISAPLYSRKKISDLSLEQKMVLAQLVAHVFDDGKDFVSKIAHNPELVACVIAEYNNQIIGFAGVTRRTIEHDGKLYTIGGYGDMVVDPIITKIVC